MSWKIVIDSDDCPFLFCKVECTYEGRVNQPCTTEQDCPLKETTDERHQRDASDL